MDKDRIDHLADFIDSRFSDTERRIHELSEYVKYLLCEINAELKRTYVMVTELEKVNFACPIPIIKETVERLDKSTRLIQLLAEKPKLVAVIFIILALIAGVPNWLTFLGIKL